MPELKLNFFLRPYYSVFCSRNVFCAIKSVFYLRYQMSATVILYKLCFFSGRFLLCRVLCKWPIVTLELEIILTVGTQSCLDNDIVD